MKNRIGDGREAAFRADALWSGWIGVNKYGSDQMKKQQLEACLPTGGRSFLWPFWIIHEDDLDWVKARMTL